MWKKISELGYKLAGVAPILRAIIALGAIFAVNIYGYLSVLPSSMMAAIGPDFVFNYSLQFSIAVGMASFLGWQLGDIAFLVSGGLRNFFLGRVGESRLAELVINIISFNFLGAAKSITLRVIFGILSFCFIFSGFSILVTIFIIVEFLVIWIGGYSYYQHRQENDEPHSVTSWIDERIEEISDMTWKDLEFAALIPLGIFFSLLLSKELGEDRANRVLTSEPVFLAQYELYAITFATSNAGLIVAVSKNKDDISEEPEFFLLGASGEAILRSRDDE